MTLKKKGSITDIPYIIAGIFSVALVAFLVTVLLVNLDTEVQGNDIFTAGSKAASNKMTEDFPAVMDGGIIFIFFGMVLVSLILASLVPIHPIFLPFYLLEYILLLWLSAGIANTYQMFVEHALFVDVAAKYQFTIFFFQYFPYAVGFFGIILAIVMYKVKRGLLE